MTRRCDTGLHHVVSVDNELQLTMPAAAAAAVVLPDTDLPADALDALAVDRRPVAPSLGAASLCPPSDEPDLQDGGRRLSGPRSARAAVASGVS